MQDLLQERLFHTQFSMSIIRWYFKLNPCHTRVASLQRSHSVLKNAERRGVRCGNASNAVETLCNRIERHAAAFVLSMLKTNAAAWRFHSVLDSTLWQRCGVF